uniref:Uncharacterized protein n=1 Tax=Melanopsichium pennsylvanicum 4 TaxID=1398559 RepID=A0A077QYK1_9BASI|nr:uncharacterized protein BN887_06027 [Melanopsichium pennsylvanicum 4]
MAEPASDAPLDLRREPNSDASSEPGVAVASDPLSGMMNGKPDVRTSAYPSEERWVPEEKREDTLTDERSGKVPNECAFRVCLREDRVWPEAFGAKVAEAERRGG